MECQWVQIGQWVQIAGRMECKWVQIGLAECNANGYKSHLPCLTEIVTDRLRCARLLRGHSTRPWHVIDGLRLRSVGQRQCRPERGVVTTARPSAESLTEYPRATPHALGVHHARLRGRSQRMLRVHVEFDPSAAWTRLGVRLVQDRQPRGFN